MAKNIPDFQADKLGFFAAAMVAAIAGRKLFDNILRLLKQGEGFGRSLESRFRILPPQDSCLLLQRIG